MLRNILTVTATGITLIALSTVTSTTANSSSAVDIDELIPALSSPPTSKEKLASTEARLRSLYDLSKDSAKIVHTDEAATYWVSRKGTAEVCLIIQLKAEPSALSASCGAVTDFYRNGLKLRLEANDLGAAAEAYILPADVDTKQLEGRVASKRATSDTHIFSGPPSELRRLTPSTLPRESGEPFTFQPLSSDGR